jgi:predicted O-methyltransferase YrrM
MDIRIEQQKNYPRAMQSYVYMLYEFIYELKPKNVLEIGVQNGQSTKTMLLALNDSQAGKLVSIDHKDRSTILDQEYPDLKPRWDFIRGDSHSTESFESAKNALPEGELYDVFFIDGDHKMPGCGQDFFQYSELVKPGGLIMLHDIVNANEDVKDLWEQITWEKFAIDWGRSRRSIIPGFGLVKKPK